MGKAIWESPIETWMGENSKLGMSLCSSWKRIILICVCGWHKIGWKETQHWSNVETTQQTSWFGKTNIIPSSCYLVCTQRRCETSKGTCWQLQNHVRIHIFAGATVKNTNIGKTDNFNVVQRCGTSCKEMCGTLLWVGKNYDSTTLQSIYSMHRWPPLQRRRNEICWKIVTCTFWNVWTWHELEDLIFYGQWKNLHDPSQNGPKLVTNDFLV